VRRHCERRGQISVIEGLFRAGLWWRAFWMVISEEVVHLYPAGQCLSNAACSSYITLIFHVLQVRRSIAGSNHSKSISHLLPSPIISSSRSNRASASKTSSGICIFTHSSIMFPSLKIRAICQILPGSCPSDRSDVPSRYSSLHRFRHSPSLSGPSHTDRGRETLS
jgi:hypothetical protein